MKVYFAADHAGFELKEQLKLFVHEELAHDVEDLGAFEYDKADDYPDYIHRAAHEVSEDPASRAIVIGGSGQGEAIAANRYEHVRAALWYGGNTDILKLSREHNDANILSLGARFMDEDVAKAAVRIWLTTEFSNEERHIRRINKLDTFHM